MVSFLVSQGASVHAVFSNGRNIKETPLHVAVRKADVEVTRMLVGLKADPFAQVSRKFSGLLIFTKKRSIQY